MDINSLKHCILFGMVVIGVSVSLPAAAQSHGGGAGHGGAGHGGAGQRGGGGSHGHGHGGGDWHGGGLGWWGLGLGLGLGWDAAVFANPYLDYPYEGYYYPYGQPGVLVEPSALAPEGPAAVAPANSSSAPNWYYCDSAKGYYPYVTQCPEPWRTVPAVPPGPAR